MKKYYPTGKAAEILGLHAGTLRDYANKGKIQFIKSAGGHRLFDVDSFIGGTHGESGTICYCRVSSAKQKEDLARQVVFMREKFPQAEIIKDIGSGLNFKRKGLQTILERILRGDKLTIIIAHRDRLCRFGFELFEFIIKKNGGELMVLDRTEESPESELTQDLLAILHVFSCRMHGLRRYTNQIAEDKDLSNASTENNIQQMAK